MLSCTQLAKIRIESKQMLGKPQTQKSLIIFVVNRSSSFAMHGFILLCDAISYTYSPEAAVVRLLFCRPLYCPKSSETLQTASRAFSLKREEEEIAEEAEDNEANDPVDGVYIDDHHVHVKSPAMRIILKVEGIKPVAPVRELASANWTCLPLKA